MAVSGARVLFILFLFGFCVWQFWGVLKPKFQRLHCFIKYYYIKQPSKSWRTRKSIYNQIKRNKKDSEQKLIDEKPKGENELRYSYGMIDAVFSPETEYIEKQATKAANLIKKISETGDQKASKEFYDIIVSYGHEKPFAEFADLIGHKVVNMGLIIFPYLFYYARDLAKYSKDRNAVKIGLNIIALCKENQAIKIAMMLGHHEEFGIHSASTIINVSVNNKINPERKLFKLAKQLSGWGRIQVIVKKAALYVGKKRNVDWLFFEGYKNRVHVMEIALYASAYGDLDARLEPDTISTKVYDVATDLIEGLLERDIEYYKPILTTFRNYIRHSYQHTSTVVHYYVLHEMLSSLKKHHKKDGKPCIAELTKILSNKKINKLIVKTASFPDAVIGRWYADKLARFHRINLFDIYWKLLQSNKYDTSLWFYAMESAKAKDVNNILNFAKEVLDLNYIASGPTTRILSHGPEWFQHDILGYIIQGLYNLPSATKNDISWELVITALNNPIVNIRYRTATLVEKWGKNKIPSNIKILIKKQITKEVDMKLKERLKQVIL